MDELNRRSRAAGSQGRTTARTASSGRQGSPAGSSRARGGSSGQRSSRADSYYSSRGRGGSSGGRNSYDRRPPVSHNKNSKRRRKPSPNYLWIAIAGAVLIVAIAIGVFLFKGNSDSKAEETSTTAQPETELQKEVMVGDIVITGLSREAAREKILEAYPWDMKVTLEGETVEIPNLMEPKVDELLQEIYYGEPKENYTLTTTGLEEAIVKQVSNLASKWDKPAKNASISSFDKESGKFVFAGEETGQKLNQEALVSQIQTAVSSKDFDAKITAQITPVEPEITEAAAKEKYKTIGKYTTKTTNNSKRNTNVRLACEAIDGLVLAPGETFSFNERVGERTAAKGYQSAAAYSNGEVVQEIGGGVCQVSTTLYNVVARSGLKTTVRRSHTFEPSYVTPGMDAAVSWGSPDYAFVNNSDAGIGIRASYSDQTCTVSIYGIPILEEGVEYDLKSTKIKDTNPPAPTYVEDQTVQPGTEVVDSAGSSGSQWEVRLIVTKNGEKISDDVDHTSTYKGHAPVVKRNTSGVWLPPPEQSLPEGTTLPGETLPSVGVPNGGETTAPSPETTAPAGPGQEPSAPSAEPEGPGAGLQAPGEGGEPGANPAPTVPQGPGTSNTGTTPASPVGPGV